MDALPPLRFAPIFQYRLWGGRKLGDYMHAELPDGPVGEAWILSDREDHASPVAEGPLQGSTLSELMSSSQAALLGRQAGKFERFPLLLKFLDVQQMLSVQVHPPADKPQFIPKGENAKTEAWVVLETDPGGRIYAGLKPHTTEGELRALNQHDVDDHLASFKPEVGQGVFIQAGTVHALGDGVLVFEVQQNSDVTYRLYDWEHVDPKTGQPRELQVDKAIACVDFAQGEVRPVTPDRAAAGAGVDREDYFAGEHFKVWRWEGDGAFDVGAKDEARVLVCIDGAGRVAHAGAPLELGRGGVVVLPASAGVCRFEPEGRAAVLEIAIPDPATPGPA